MTARELERRAAWLEERIGNFERVLRSAGEAGIVASNSNPGLIRMHKHLEERRAAFTAELDQVRETIEDMHAGCDIMPCDDCMAKARLHSEDYRL